MEKAEKILAIQHVIDHPNTEELYYDLLKHMGDLKSNYYDYMSTEPINCDIELKRLPEADYDLCAALLTTLLREDHFCKSLKIHPICLFFFTSERTSLLHLHPLAVWREEGTTLSQRGHRAYQERKAP